MNIAIDMRPALSRPTGVGVYLLNLVSALLRIDESNQYFLFSSSWKERYPRTIYGSNVQIYDFHWPVQVLNFAWNRLSWPPLESILRASLDIVHCATPLVIPTRKARKITMAYDLHFLAHPEHTVREIHRDYSALIRKHCLLSDAVIAISEYTKQQLIQRLEIPASRIHTIHLAADSYFHQRALPNEIETVRKHLKLDQDYFLFVGTQEPRKNLPALLKAFAALPSNAVIVLAGPEGWQTEPWRSLINERVRIAGYVSKQELRALYQSAIALVMPSLEEGFGLPILEAMASQTPVIASDIPVFHEIGGNSYVAVDPASVESIAAAMLKLWQEPAERQNLIAQGIKQAEKFSWDETARKTLEIYRNM
jgi:glycosyltransferase involved in cell wall biosynthesis